MRCIPEPRVQGKQIRHYWFPINDDLPLRLDEVQIQCDEDGFALFVLPGAVSYGGTTADDVLAMKSVLVDIDNSPISEKTDALIEEYGEPSLIVESGGVTAEGEQKQHVYFVLDKASDPQAVAIVRHVLAVQFDGDTSFQNPAQLVRAPGSSHRKKGHRETRIVKTNPGSHSLAKFSTQVAPISRELNGAGYSIEELKAHSYVAGEQVNGLHRWEALSRAVGYYARQIALDKLTYEQAELECVAFVEEHIEGYKKGHALRALRKFVRKDAKELARLDPNTIGIPPPPKPRPRTTTLVSARDMVSKPVRPEWLIHGILETKLFGVIFGGPGSGKSYITIGWGLSIAAGVPWLGKYAVKQGAVVYAAGEGFAGLTRRVKAWCDYRGFDVPDNMYFTRKPVIFNDPESLQSFIDEIDKLDVDPVVIIIDTVARATPGLDLNSASDMATFIGAVDQLRHRYDCAVLAVHHSGHRDSNRGYGSIALKGAIDFEAGVKRPNDGGPSEMWCTKMKDGDEFETIFLEFNEVDVVLGSFEDPFAVKAMTVSKADAPKEKANKNRREKRAADRSLISDIMRGECELSEQEVRKKFYELRDGKESTKMNAFREAWTLMLDAGHIVEDEGAYRLAL
ncbi:MAG: AAA family ATPase [Pseudomonadota bacterium]